MRLTQATRVVALVAVSATLTAADSYRVTHGTNQNIDEHSNCRNVTNNFAGGNDLFVPTKTSTEWTTFYSNPPAGVSIASCGCTVTPGSQSFTTAGSQNFVVPCHNTLTVQVWGGGGGGGGYESSYQSGTAGGASSWNSGTLQANGGAGSSTGAGAGGTASGGTTNTTGGNGEARSLGTYAGAGGNGANGGAGGARKTTNGVGNNGTAPGGGGSGCFYEFSGVEIAGGGGGGGGYSTRAYAAGTYAVAASIPLVVGGAGLGGRQGETCQGGNGAVGRVTVTWN